MLKFGLCDDANVSNDASNNAVVAVVVFCKKFLRFKVYAFIILIF